MFAKAGMAVVVALPANCPNVGAGDEGVAVCRDAAAEQVPVIKEVESLQPKHHRVAAVPDAFFDEALMGRADASCVMVPAVTL